MKVVEAITAGFARSGPMSAKPSLLCLNLRREWLGADLAWVEPARTVLTYARSHSWRVAHAHCQGGAASENAGALEGLEAVRSDAVFNVQGLSAFHSHAVRQWALESAGPIYLIGGVYGLAGAATVVGAHVLNMHARIIAEACGDASDWTPDAQNRAHISALAHAIAMGDLLKTPQLDDNVIDLDALRLRSSDGSK